MVAQNTVSNPPSLAAAGFATSSSLQPQATIKKATTTTTTGLKETEEDLNKRTSFLSEFVVLLREQTLTDIQLKPNDGPAIPAHRALLAARSPVFKNILESDGLKAPPSDAETLTLSELNTEALNSFLEFLYTGNLPFDKLSKSAVLLYVAAHKYEIPYLQECCEQFMLKHLSATNAVKLFKFADAQSNEKLKEIALNFIVMNMKSIVSTKEFEDFAIENPRLSLQNTRRAFGDETSFGCTSCYIYFRDNLGLIHSNHMLQQNQNQQMLQQNQHQQMPQLQQNQNQRMLLLQQIQRQHMLPQNQHQQMLQQNQHQQH